MNEAFFCCIFFDKFGEIYQNVSDERGGGGGREGIISCLFQDEYIVNFF